MPFLPRVAAWRDVGVEGHLAQAHLKPTRLKFPGLLQCGLDAFPASGRGMARRRRRRASGAGPPETDPLTPGAASTEPGVALNAVAGTGDPAADSATDVAGSVGGQESRSEINGKSTAGRGGSGPRNPAGGGRAGAGRLSSGRGRPTVRTRSRPRAAPALVDGESDTTWLERVKKQVNFYFSDANLRRDRFMRKKMEEGDGYVELSAVLNFNRIRAMKCRYMAQLVQAIRKSDMLVLNEDKTCVRRDVSKVPIEDADPLPRTIYVEGIPIPFSLDDLALFFARHGTVRYVDLPRHAQTREPRGFCFVEFADEAQADAAVAALDGTWPEWWPNRYDEKVLRAMTKRRWLEYRREYQVLQKWDKGAAARRPAADGAGRSARGGIAGARAAAMPEVPGADAATVPCSTPSASSSAPAPATGPAASQATADAAAAVPEPSRAVKGSRGCLLQVSGFSLPQTRSTVRQFVEHAVTVLYCDYIGGDSIAHVRLGSKEECEILLNDLRLTQRMLGWLRPEVKVLMPEEEKTYWSEVDKRRAERDSEAAAVADDAAGADAARPQSDSPAPKRARRSLQAVQEPESMKIVAQRGPVKTSTVQPWPRHRAGLRAGAAKALATTESPGRQRGSQKSASLIDTVGGNRGFTQAGFGRPRLGRKQGGRQRKGSVADGPLAGPSLPQPCVPPSPAPVAATGEARSILRKSARAGEDPGRWQRIPPLPPPPPKRARRINSPQVPPPSPFPVPPSGAKPKRGPSGARWSALSGPGKAGTPGSLNWGPPPSPIAVPGPWSGAATSSALPTGGDGAASAEDKPEDTAEQKDSMLEDVADILGLM
mmetsp:Transcript_41727/g.90977  ORF Transcript_41727/g.90977 Transcript_41727/m.90977 type:complete len:826 (-) Transcript_41727:70-2547(-)